MCVLSAFSIQKDDLQFYAKCGINAGAFEEKGKETNDGDWEGRWGGMSLSIPVCSLVKEEENLIRVITGLGNISPVEMCPLWILGPRRRAGSGSQPGVSSLAISPCDCLLSPFVSLFFPL